jgi:hypothetical protein
MFGPPWVIVRVEEGSEERKSVKLGRDIAVRLRRRLRNRQYSAAKASADSPARERQQQHYSLQNGLLLRNSASARVSPMSFSILSSSAASCARSRLRRRQ